MLIAGSLLLMVVFGASLSLLWSASTAALRVPIQVPNNTQLIVSLASVFAASAYAARKSGRWYNGAITAMAAVLLNWGLWMYVSSRFLLPDVFRVGALGVGGAQILWWLLVIVVGTVAGLVGGGLTVKRRRHGEPAPIASPLVAWTLVIALALCVVLTLFDGHAGRGAWAFESRDNSPQTVAGYFRQISKQKVSDVAGAKHMRAVSKGDGTQFDLFAFDVGRPELKKPLIVRASVTPSEDIVAAFSGVGRVGYIPAALTSHLKTSRVSAGRVGRTAFCVLVVHDPDSEAASRRQYRSGAVQTGGWDASQTRTFWRQMGAIQSSDLARGDCSQILYRWQRSLPRNARFARRSGWAHIYSSEPAVTVCSLNNRPVRATIPTVPPSMIARAGVGSVYTWGKSNK